jgi:polar amino acid transport system substrate-binding protein
MYTRLFSRFGAGSAAAVVLTVAILSGCATAPTVTPAARSELAPTGKLRVGLLVTNSGFVTKDGAPAEMQGVGVEIGRELAKQLNVAFEPVRYKNLASLLDGVRKGEWDVAPIGYSAERTKDMDFTAIYSVVTSYYLVPTGSPIRNVADIDKPGHRITVIARSVGDAYLSANLKHAAVIRTKIGSEAFELIKSGKAQAQFANGPTARNLVAQWPEFRLVEGGVRAGEVALAIAKGRPAGTAYAKEFIEYAKASGLIQEAIERAGLPDDSVAPPASTSTK